MKLKYTYTRLNVENYEACKLFYEEVLGFKVLFADESRQYAELDAGEIKITLFNRAGLGEFIGSMEAVTYDLHDAKIVLTFTVDNLDEVITHLKNHDISIINLPWQRLEDGLMGSLITACFRDPDGNLIELQQILS